jgi:hypothetical protein
MRRFRPIVFIIVLLSWCVPLAAEESFFDKFVDPTDGKVDMSEWLQGVSGFLPVPIVISDPAVGYGGGLALAFFHDPEGERPMPSEDPNAPLRLPPSVSVVAGAYTENDSGLMGFGHVGSYREDTFRYTGFAGYADMNLKFYGGGDFDPVGDQSQFFNIEGVFLFQEAKFRIADTPFFVGGRYSFLTSNVDFQYDGAISGIPPDEVDITTGGLGLVINYDSRDNIVSPNKGHLAKLETMLYNEAFLGDFNYTKMKAASFSYWPLRPDLTLGVRLEGDFSSGDVPFFDLPFIQMRGIPALRYQGNQVLVGELEGRWDMTQRWSLVGFAGSGWTGDTIGDLPKSSAEVAGGGGFRYLIARRYNLRVGIDVAWGPENTVVYLGVGSSWN